jgi:multidrug efflux pump subunit AcrB
MAYRSGLGVCETSTVIGVSEISVAVVASLVVAIVVMLGLAFITRLVGSFSIAVAIALAVIAVAIMVFPFGLTTSKTTSNGTTLYEGISNRCRSPIVSAWHRERDGHFARPKDWPSCVDPARRRLAVGGVLIAGGALVVIVPRRRSARHSTPVPA